MPNTQASTYLELDGAAKALEVRDRGLDFLRQRRDIVVLDHLEESVARGGLVQDEVGRLGKVK